MWLPRPVYSCECLHLILNLLLTPSCRPIFFLTFCFFGNFIVALILQINIISLTLIQIYVFSWCNVQCTLQTGYIPVSTQLHSPHPSLIVIHIFVLSFLVMYPYYLHICSIPSMFYIFWYRYIFNRWLMCVLFVAQWRPVGQTPRRHQQPESRALHPTTDTGSSQDCATHG